MQEFCLEVGGEFACFTRAEMKVERVSYDVITPSAARAVFEAVLWKPAIRWLVRRIEVLKPIRWASVRRNEVGAVASPRKECIFIEDDRQQRAGLLLRDVRYRLHARLEYIPPERRAQTLNPVPERLQDAEEKQSARADESPGKYLAMFERRAKKGQCFHRPYLGCREFAADFRFVDNPAAEPAPIADTRELGWMLYDLDYSDPQNVKPMFFYAQLENGTVTVPAPDSGEVRR